jgi:hypothetical protein
MYNRRYIELTEPALNGLTRKPSGFCSLHDAHDACTFEVPLVIVGSWEEMMVTLRDLRASALCWLNKEGKS